MRFSKNIILFLCILFLVSLSFAQSAINQEEEAQIHRQHQAQRKRIDSLYKILYHARDTTRVNCLNRLSPEYYIFSTDTAWNLANEAYKLAEKLTFPKGMAEGLNNLGQIIQERSDINGAEKYFRQVPGLYLKINALKDYNKANRILGYNLMLQLRYDEARILFTKTLDYYRTSGDEEGLAYIYRVIGKSYEGQGYYEKAFEYLLKDLEISRKITENGTRRSLFMGGNYYMASLYKEAGDNKTALEFFQLSAQRAKENELPDYYNSRMADIYILSDNYDSA
ncbi:MAG: tetratricopeptide repeat protein, partial [Chitinophagaceae bacterium]